MLLNFEISVSK